MAGLAGALCLAAAAVSCLPPAQGRESGAGWTLLKVGLTSPSFPSPPLRHGPPRGGQGGRRCEGRWRPAAPLHPLMAAGGGRGRPGGRLRGAREDGAVLQPGPAGEERGAGRGLGGPGNPLASRGEQGVEPCRAPLHPQRCLAVRKPRSV